MLQLVTSHIGHATKMSSHALGKKKKQVYCKHFDYVFRFMCKADYNNDKFIHIPKSTSNKVMQLLELASVIKCDSYSKECVW